MNAGGSRSEGWSISDKIVSVTALYKNEKIQVIEKSNCAFGHRQSLFKNNTDYVVLGAEFQFDKGVPDEFVKKREERISLCKKYQDSTKPNFGSVFCLCNSRIMNLVRSLSLGNSNGVHFSSKTKNWLLNEGNGTFSQAEKLIKVVTVMHRILGKKCKAEVVIWK